MVLIALFELLDGKIQIIESAKDWKEAIRISAQPLLDNDSIEERYINAMIDMCEKYDAYIVLTDLFAMPHASPESGVKKTDAALTISKEPIDFSGKLVQVLLTLASADSDSHLKALRELTKFLSDGERIGRLIRAETPGEAEKLIQEAFI